MKKVVGEILPLALVIAISPINVIPVVLLLFTKKPLVKRCCFVGFIAGVAAMLVALVAIAEAVDLSPGSGHATWVAVLKLALGAYLLVAAVRKFRGRPRDGEEGAMPKWMDGIAGFSPNAVQLGAGGSGHTGPWWASGLCPRSVSGSFDVPLHVLAFDDPRVAS